jgi:hypothetical protein
MIILNQKIFILKQKFYFLKKNMIVHLLQLNNQFILLLIKKLKKIMKIIQNI